MQILIVDDSKAMRMIVTRTLRQAGFADHDYAEAVDGVTALAAIESNPPDLILCDWNMPEMSGIELLRTLRASGNEVHFGFVTSESTPAMRNTADENGAMFLIAKPFTAETFSTALAGVLV
jgi:two-component system chemotaxis response regulator CheY